MKLPAPLHPWAVTPVEAIAIQRRLRRRVVEEKPAGPFRLIAGLDAAFPRDGRWCIAAVVLWDARERRVVEQHVAAARLRFPYIPGLLSFLEAPALLAALGRLRRRPHALLCDGQGRAHPRRFGIACHVGVLTGLPSIGCAKSRLTGSHREPGARRGSSVVLADGPEPIGAVLRTRDGVKPVYVSVGHHMDLATARRIVLACGGGFRLPEPTRLADQRVNAAARRPLRRGYPTA